PTRSRPRRSRSTCAASPTRPPSTPPARTTGPGRPSTTGSTPPTWAGTGPPARCWCSGEPTASPAGPRTRWPPGGPCATTSAARASPAATSCPRRRRPRPWPRWTGSSPKGGGNGAPGAVSGGEQHLEHGPELVLGLDPLGVGVGAGDDPGPGQQVGAAAVEGGAAQGDRPLAVAGVVDPADRAGVAAPGERLQGGGGGPGGVGGGGSRARAGGVGRGPVRSAVISVARWATVASLTTSGRPTSTRSATLASPSATASTTSRCC